ncbi:hypothetical protein PQU92_12465 [Asticcacaulis sp. BYS171W]|uniref:Lipoprotein n=1 Tax=Asticcacaulis aquaticus TaxID=2984212 RepID=A0ABT5HW80_9CAUL|nr:hypothetical protein [Asticcacaulis aquaticus]MDC7684095.1 hypothetical protein [Asticcacaulis aquaticus]
MKRVAVILGGAGLLCGGLSACSDPNYAYVPVDNRTQAQKAEACVQQFEPTGQAPQVMTYDSQSKTEVHLNQEGKVVTVTAQNKPDATALGMEGKVGGSRPTTCTDATVARGGPAPKETKSSWWWKK